MNAMERSLGGFRAALLIGWIALGIAGVLYAREKSIPAWAAAPLLAAFLLEYPFYLAAGVAAARERLRGRALPGILALSALAPYLVYSIGTGTFSWEALARLAVLAAALSWWYALLPARPPVDLAYLALPAMALLFKYFDPIYVDATPDLQAEALGHLALVHICALALLVQRRVADTGFGFLPNRREWRVGFLHFLYFLPVGVPAALALGLIRAGPVAPGWKLAGTFFGILWVVALSEEFFFRGLLQQWLEKWTGRPALALAAVAVLFGIVHLGFRAFPNWRFALLAALAGWFYGRAYRQARSIRASMVTHALVVVTWRAAGG
jgi:membrane protease YdiL (CAAX protease family)